MTASFPHVTHHFEKNPENGTFAVKRVTPIIRLAANGSSLYMQQGKVLDEGGNVMIDLPGWFYEEVGKASDQALVEAGFKTRPVRPGVETVKSDLSKPTNPVKPVKEVEAVIKAATPEQKQE